MFKEVGASGQISLGKKYAGRMFDMSLAADGRITLVPVQVVPMVQETQASYAVASAPRVADAAVANQAWAQAHAQDIAAYNAWAAEREPYAQRVRRWREEQAENPTDLDGAA